MLEDEEYGSESSNFSEKEGEDNENKSNLNWLSMITIIEFGKKSRNATSTDSK